MRFSREIFLENYFSFSSKNKENPENHVHGGLD
jgi:hypothetical protein